MVMENETKWLQSKIVRVMAFYLGFIIMFTYAIEWVGRHAVAVFLAVLSFLALIVAYWLYKRYREW